MAKDARATALDHLDAAAAAVRDACPTRSERLAQFDAHMATVRMCTEHLFDEAAREVK